MKAIFVLGGFVLSLSSCLVVQDNITQPDPIACPYIDRLAQPTVANEAIHLPNLNLNPSSPIRFAFGTFTSVCSNYVNLP